MTTSLVTDYEHGISAIDAQFHRPRRAAIHLIVEDGKMALVDTGTTSSISGVISTIEEKNLSAEDVHYIILTHIHLDHAGGASECMRRFPNAKLVVHPRGARHMADPDKLVAGAIAVYGKAAFERVYGEIRPIDRQRIIEASDESRIELNGRSLLFIDTPGHARHHNCIYDEQSNAFFTGDTFGVSYRELDVSGIEFVFPTTTPVQFDPSAAHASLDRIMRFNPEFAFLTHYSRISHLHRHVESMHNLIDAHVKIARSAGTDHNGHDDRFTTISSALQSLLLQRIRKHGSRLPEAEITALISSDVKLNTQGLEHWLDHAN
ncbi:MBL fold metallo-hydrolase [Nitrosomonas sp.]|uniref:MBL fold metallo-hydrolase n=1 Tax=Nitrosomonas sp. TaxID=42353 RepID=UPI001DED92A2|nr:MBL fold metallo-hydrolase [Nitrosomonas sp.]MCB1947359.1 MBL fold metallo-hydrolase [Nitrosomonas sp.]